MLVASRNTLLSLLLTFSLLSTTTICHAFTIITTPLSSSQKQQRISSSSSSSSSSNIYTKLYLSAVSPPRKSSSNSEFQKTSNKQNNDNTEPVDVPVDEVVVNQLSKNNNSSNNNNNNNSLSELIDLNQILNELADYAGIASTRDLAVKAAVKAEQLYFNSDNKDLISFNTMLKAWSKTCSTLAEIHTGRYRDKTNTNNNNNNKNSKQQQQQSNIINELHTIDVTDIPIYTAKDAAIHVENLLQKQILVNKTSQQNDNNIIVQPDNVSYGCVMDAWSKCSRVYSDDATEHVEKLFSDIINTKPDLYVYNSIIDTYSYCNLPNRLNIITKYHNKMIEQSNQENDYNNNNNNNSDDDDNNKSSIINPYTARTMNSIMHAYSKMALEERENSKKYVDIVLELFQQMKDRYYVSRVVSEHPDTMTYTTVIECLSRSQSIRAAEQADELFHELKHLKDTIGMERYKPTAYTYTSLIKAWSKSKSKKATQRVEELMDEICNSNDIEPNVIVFISAIQAWGYSRDSNKATKVLQLLQKMRSMSNTIHPNLMVYNTAIDACARTRGTQQQQMAALRIAFAIFKTLEQESTSSSNNDSSSNNNENNTSNSNIHPSHVTFVNLLKCVAYLLPDGEMIERNTITKAIFNKAISYGQVNKTVIQMLQKACDSSVYYELLTSNGLQLEHESHFNLDKIPSSWRRHVREY